MGCLSAAMPIVDIFLFWFPFYNEMKLVFVVFLWYPGKHAGLCGLSEVGGMLQG